MTLRVGNPSPASQSVQPKPQPAAAPKPTASGQTVGTSQSSFEKPAAARPAFSEFLKLFQPSAKPTPLALEALKSASEKTSQYILFNPPAGVETTRGLVFLGGAKVQEEAYAPIAKALAERGVAVAIARSPGDLPFLQALPFVGRIDAAVKALRSQVPDLPVALGGHSAGGFVASSLKRKDVDALVLLNSRTQGRAPRPDVDGVAVFGGQDGLISAEERTKTAQELPDVFSVLLNDLDHDYSQGLYGAQDGDPITNRSPQDLIDRAASAIAGWAVSTAVDVASEVAVSKIQSKS
jgi:pimeloyl-ACP methyl ester carboxylesterase